MRVFATFFASLFLISGPAYAQAEVLSTITADQLVSLLAQDNRDPKIEEDGFISYLLQGEGWNPGSRVYARPVLCGEEANATCQGVRLLIWINKEALPKAKLATINEFNGKYILAKAYLTDEGGVRFGMDILIEGGVTENNIVANLQKYELILAVLFNDLS